MPDPSGSSPTSPGEKFTLAVDAERAEAILHDIAVELRAVAFAGGAAAMHVRALALKRDVARWTEAAPTGTARQARIDELLALHEEVKAARKNRP